MGAGRSGRWLAAVGAAAGALACGPSYQALYEGDSRFEHCYALEESGSANMQQKADCWTDWTHRYTYGQTRDRVEYAVARSRALSRAPVAPTDEAMMEAAPGEGRAVTTIAAPAPTSAFAPPPTILAADAGAYGQTQALPGYADGGGAGGVTEESAPAPPGSACGTACDAAWTKCHDGCGVGAKCDLCALGYKRCMKNCFAK
jgi:hypothetical protein